MNFSVGGRPGGLSGARRRIAVMSSPSIFTRILAGDIPGEILHETDRVFVLRDIAPQAPVHLLVIPKTEQYANVVELAAGDPSLLAEMVEVANSMAAAAAASGQGDGDFRLDLQHRRRSRSDRVPRPRARAGRRPVGRIPWRRLTTHERPSRTRAAAPTRRRRRCTSGWHRPQRGGRRHRHGPPPRTPGSLSQADRDPIPRRLRAGARQRVTLSGPDGSVRAARRLIEELLQMVRDGRELEPRRGRHLRPHPRGRPHLEPLRPARPGDPHRARARAIRPKTIGQRSYVDAIDHNTITFGIGPAGTGKTYLAMAKAVQALQRKEVSRIILTRPAVEAGERLGYLPGTPDRQDRPVPATRCTTRSTR